ncbi:hypothetical protein AQUCO_01400300v1, partial [Aquilegia coerulea]
ALSKNFVSKFGSKLPETVVLKVLTGKATNVGLTRTKEDIFFEHGWALFVVENSLEENDLLVFTFNESTSCFDLLLFDKTACGKEVVVSIEGSVDSGIRSLQIDKDCTDDVLSGSSSSNSIESSGNTNDSSWNNSVSSSSLVKGHKRGTKKNRKNANDDNQQTSKFRGKAQSSRLPCSRTKERVSLVETKSKENYAGTSRKLAYYHYFQSERRRVTPIEEIMALRKAEAVRSSRPNFIQVMKPYHVYTRFFVTLPRTFVKH